MRRRPWTAPVLIVVLALAVRLIAIVATPDYLPIFDAADYERHAASIAAGDGYPRSRLAPGPSSFRPPLYPLLLAGIDVVGGGTRAFRLLGALLGAVAVLLVIELSVRVWGRRTGLLAGVITALFPPLVGMSVTVLSEALFIALVLAALLAVMQFREDARLRWALVAGLLCGLATLTRSNGLLLLIPAAIGVWTMRPRISRVAMVAPLTVALAMALTVAPWVVRNTLAFDRFVGLGAPTGYLFASTYSEEARSRAQHPGEPRAAHLLRSNRDVFTRPELDEIARWSILGDRARTYMLDHPAYVVAGAAWNALRILDVEHSTTYVTSFQVQVQALGMERLAKPWLQLGALFGVLALALVGAAMQARAPPEGRAPGFVWLFPALLIAPALVAYGLPRYRAPVDPFLIMLAAHALVGGVDRVRRR